MYINEAIERADKLLNNEYSLEEKYHWCDIVGGELVSSVLKHSKSVELVRWSDGTFLMPEDCDFTRIEKIILNNREIEKNDMDTFGLKAMYGKDGRWFIKAKHSPQKITVIYRTKYEPIRRISLANATVTFDIATLADYYNGFIMGRECPFIAGDSVRVVIDGTEYIFHITKRTAQFDDKKGELTYLLDCDISNTDISAKIAAETMESKVSAEMERIVTDKTVCEAPWDEMYVDYLCAQICFYQQDMPMYQQFITRYNERKQEYANWVQANAPEPDNSQFKNWW